MTAVTKHSPAGLYTAEQVYALDKMAIDIDAQPGLQLMYRAALAVWRNLQCRWPQIGRMLVFAGCGNNGGDAYAIACLARDDGLAVEVISMGDMSRQSTESAHFRRWWLEAGGFECEWSGQIPDCDAIVDGLLGIGLNKALDKQWIALIEAINQHPALRISVDIPSGLNADRGTAQPVAVQADLTVSFIGRKLGCFIADGPDFCGEYVFDDLGLARSSARRVNALAELLDERSICLPARRLNNSFKNRYGHVLVIGGCAEFAGAAHLAAAAALRMGAGLVSLCVHPLSATRMPASEIMLGTWPELEQMSARASVVVIGPGLGRSEQAIELLERAGKLALPMVVDADALREDFLDGLASEEIVLTPHPGEAARLLGLVAEDIQNDRVQALQALVRRWPCVAVLKGSGTLVGGRESSVSVCSRGHAGMATAGMGDVLAGLIGSLLAQGLTAQEAARSGVLIHALAAELFAEQQHADCVIASDVTALLGRVMNNLQQQRGAN